MSTETADRPTITLMTDFGVADAYVGAMKGVILSIIPQVNLVDLTHSVAPQDVHHAAFLLSTVIDYFPTGTIHLVVVDPGVGSERRPIAVQSKRAYYVAPDNGVLSMALTRQPAETIVHLTNSDYWLPHVSHTFHGRDIFAPVAAHLVCGVPITELGGLIDDIAHLPTAEPTRHPDGTILGQIQHIDRFGNCITNVPAEMLADKSPLTVKIGGRTIQGISPTYAAVEPGRAVALIGSTGFLEVAVRNDSAAARLGISVDDKVVVELQ